MAESMYEKGLVNRKAVLGAEYVDKSIQSAALTNGVCRTELREVLMQTAIYCGVPAAVDAFRNASEVFKEVDKK